MDEGGRPQIVGETREKQEGNTYFYYSIEIISIIFYFLSGTFFMSAKQTVPNPTNIYYRLYIYIYYIFWKT